MQYTVQFVDGRTFGPVTTDRLVVWAQQRRIPTDAYLVPSDGSPANAVRYHAVVWEALTTPPPPGQPTPPGVGAPPMPEDIGAFDRHPRAGNPAAIMSLVCGVLSIVPALGLLLGPVAIALWWRSSRLLKTQQTTRGAVPGMIGLVLGAVSTLAQYGWFLGIIAGVFPMPSLSP